LSVVSQTIQTNYQIDSNPASLPISLTFIGRDGFQHIIEADFISPQGTVRKTSLFKSDTTPLNLVTFYVIYGTQFEMCIGRVLSLCTYSYKILILLQDYFRVFILNKPDGNY
jgi:hypothetical protein